MPNDPIRDADILYETICKTEQPTDLSPLSEQNRLTARAEHAKFTAVAKKLLQLQEHPNDTSTRDQQRIATAYLRTQPSEPMRNLFAKHFSALNEFAEETIVKNSDLSILREQIALHKFLHDPKDPGDALQELRTLAARHDSNQLIHFGIQSDTLDETIAAMALATFTQRTEFAGTLLSYAAASTPSAHFATIFAAILDPSLALQTLGKILADAIFENPEDPSVDHSSQRARTLIVARTIIPYIGSPLPHINPSSFSQSSEKITELVFWTQRLWEGWRLLVATT